MKKYAITIIPITDRTKNMLTNFGMFKKQLAFSLHIIKFCMQLSSLFSVM